MTDKKDDGGPAFPLTAHKVRFGGGTTPLRVPAERGMSLRDYFAAKAIVGLLSLGDNRITGHENDDQGALLAANAYAVADAMLKKRSYP